MASDLANNEFWVKKMIARFHALDLNKDGVLSKADFDIFTERIIQIRKLSEAQAERTWKLHNEIVSVFGGENLKLTLTEASNHKRSSQQVLSELYIQFQSFITYCVCLRHLGDYPSMVANKFFDVIDTDDDGIISYTEWAVYFECIGIDVKHARPCFDALDTNKDGMQQSTSTGAQTKVTPVASCMVLFDDYRLCTSCK